MDVETREKMVVAFDNLVRVAGAPSFEEGMRQAEALTGLLSNWILFTNQFIRQIQTIDDLRAQLDSHMNLSEKDQALLLSSMENLPEILRLGVAEIARSVAPNLPTSSGRKARFTAQQAREVLDHISKLNRQGALLHVAKNRAAQKFGCGLRTIERVWANRASIPLEDKPTIPELLAKIIKEAQADGWQLPVSFEFPESH